MFFNIKSIKSDVFTWLDQIKEDCLSEENKQENEENDKSVHENINDEQNKRVMVTKDEMKQLILEYSDAFVAMDLNQTIKLCE